MILDTTGRPYGTGNGGGQLPPGSMAEIRALTTSALLERLQWARQAGITFGGARDEYEILGYDRVITTRQYRGEYERGGIAGRIVDALPNATWRGSFELIEDEDPKVTTEFEKAWHDLDTRLQIQAKLNRVDKLAGLSTYAVLLIGAPGDFTEELPKGKPDDLLYLTPFSGGGGPTTNSSQRVRIDDADATIFEFDVDPASPRFGLPKSYYLRRTSFTSDAFMRPVHWSRIIHVAENLLDDEVNGQPALERVWNLLCDLRKVTGGGAEAFWLRANQGMHLDIDKDMPLQDAEAAKRDLLAQAELYKHQLTRWLRTRGVTAEPLGSDVANFGNPADAILTQIAGAKAIPKRILTGSEMGELASSQDRDNWKDQVNGRQTGYAGPYIVRPFVDRLIAYGYLPTPKKGVLSYEVRWPQMQVMTAAEKVEGATGWAAVNAAQAAVNGGVPVFTDEEIRDHWEQMPPLSDEQRAEVAKRKAEQQAAAAPAAAPPDGLQRAAPPDGLQRAAQLGREYDLSSTQVQLPEDIAARVREFGSSIPEDDLAEDGREDDVHVTVKYGLHTSDVAAVRRVLRGFGPVTLALGQMNYFDAEDYDVLHVEVESADLHELNARISSRLTVTDTHPIYVPHVTIAYLKKGLGEKYRGDDRFAGMTATIDRVRFSPAGDEDDEDVLLGRMLGGAGSGNFGHAGRPGEVGGSAAANFGTPTRPPIGQDPAPGRDYYYHSAPASALGSIVEKGLITSSAGHPISLSPHLDSVYEWGGLIGRKDDESVLLRMKRTAVRPSYSGMPLLDEDDPDFDPAKTDEYDANDPSAELATWSAVPPSRLEAHLDGRWLALSSLKERTLEAPIEDELVEVLRAAMEAGAVEVIDAIVGSEVRRRALGGSGSGNFGHAGRPGQIGGSASGAGVAGVPSNVRNEVKLRHATYRTPEEVNDRIQEYLSRYNIKLDGPARSMTDTDKGVAITLDTPSEVRKGLAHAYQHRINSPEWMRLTAGRSRQEREQDFVSAFAALVTSKPAQDIMRLANPLEAAVVATEGLFHGAENIFHEWGWI